MKERLGWLVLALTLAAPVGALAHEGHEHRLMGTIKSVDATHLVLVTTDAKTKQEKAVDVALTSKTKFRRGDAPTEGTALKAGERAVVSVGDGKEPLKATEVRVGAAK
jgi:hypothetical protein